MKRILLFVVALFLLLTNITACSPVEIPSGNSQSTHRLSDFVGVWTDTETTNYYRFTQIGTWFCYNLTGEVVDQGSVRLESNRLVLTGKNEKITTFTLDESKERLLNESQTVYRRTDSPASLISSKNYENYFDIWYEDANLNGNVLHIYEPAVWEWKRPDGTVISSGDFFAYAGEEENLYLFDSEENSFFGIVYLTDDGIEIRRVMENERVSINSFAVKDRSTEKKFYFKEKDIDINYYFGEGKRLLRNGGAAFNDAHDYKKMPVNCAIDLQSDYLDTSGNRQLVVVVTYEFLEKDMPSLSGGVIYNTVRYSQYDYYTGELFYLDDSTGTEHLSATWTTMHDDTAYTIRCDFTSRWEYPKNEDALVRFKGEYRLTIPKNYDGFVICLRPVFNSYSAQVSASITPQKGTLLLEDLGDDVDKSIFCRVEKYSQKGIERP